MITHVFVEIQVIMIDSLHFGKVVFHFIKCVVNNLFWLRGIVQYIKLDLPWKVVVKYQELIRLDLYLSLSLSGFPSRRHFQILIKLAVGHFSSCIEKLNHIVNNQPHNILSFKQSRLNYTLELNWIILILLKVHRSVVHKLC